MTDQQILAKLGLSDHDAKDLIQKVNSLNAAQVKALIGATTDPEEAAESLGPDCKPSDLHRFLSGRKGLSRGTAQIYYGQGGPEKEEEEED